VHAVLPFESNVDAVQDSPLTPVVGCSVMVVLALVKFRLPVSVAIWLMVRVPVVTLNVAVVAFATTVTDAGAVKAGDPLFPSVTTAPPTGAACDNVTVHVALPFEDIVEAVHDNALIFAGACSTMVALAVDPFTVPVSVAV
jgi:hypothetical protein